MFTLSVGRLKLSCGYEECVWVAGGTPNRMIAPDQDKAVRETTTIFVGAVVSMIRDKLVDTYLRVRLDKDLWDAL